MDTMSAEEAIQAGVPQVEPPRRMPLRWPRGATWTTFVCAAVCLSVGVDLMQMFAELDKARALADILQGRPGIDRYLQAQQLTTIFSVILLVLFFTSTALAMRWIYISYRNLFGLRVEGLTYTPIDAIKSCFLPTSWLTLPYRIIQEIWLASDPALPSGSSAWRMQAGSWLIRVWWVLFLARFLRISISINPFPADNRALLTVLQVAAWCTVASAAMGAIAGTLFIVILIGIERRQWQRYDRL